LSLGDDFPPGTDVLRPELVGVSLELKLVVVSGPDYGKELALREGSYRIGKRSGLDLVLTDPAVSGEHLQVRVLRNSVRFQDRRSRNGSYCRGMKFEVVEVRPGVVVRIGRTDLQVLPVAEPLPLRPADGSAFGALVGESLAMRQAFALLQRAASGGADVLLQGETGTGKDLAAEALHELGVRARKPFIVCDLAAMAPTLIESELFGHVRGAFTGAVAERMGAFERAHEGTIFLDEVGDLPLDLQPRLLRALERRQIKRVGGDRYETVDLRVVAATHRKLDEEVKAGRFREDLYHRLAMVTVVLPPLRDRLEDVPVLVDTLLERLGVPSQREAFLTSTTQLLLRSYDWPGNVRELRNVIERAVKLGTHPTLPARTADHPADRAASGRASADLPFKEAKEELVAAFERDYLVDLMKRCQGNVSLASREARLARVYLHRLLHKHGLRL
jgi:two-component system, NtrC family, nitrogen regulation response regulator GlnG